MEKLTRKELRKALKKFAKELLYSDKLAYYYLMAIVEKI